VALPGFLRDGGACLGLVLDLFWLSRFSFSISSWKNGQPRYLVLCSPNLHKAHVGIN
jgi:hypothetical protein